jgi:hypothetical protein
VTDSGHAPDVKDSAERRLRAMFEKLDAQVGAGPWALGQRYSRAKYFTDPRETRGFLAVSCGPSILVMQATEHADATTCADLIKHIGFAFFHAEAVDVRCTEKGAIGAGTSRRDGWPPLLSRVKVVSSEARMDVGAPRGAGHRLRPSR